MVYYLAANTLKETKSDICLAEYGFPLDPFMNYEKSHEGFYLAIALSKEKFLDIKNIEKNLSSYAWKLNELNHDQCVYVFTCFIKYNKRHLREIQQTRASQYLLCSLAKILV